MDDINFTCDDPEFYVMFGEGSDLHNIIENANTEELEIA